MEHLTVELVLWILLAFFVGCIIGCVLRQAVSGRRAPEMAAPGAEPVEQAGGEAAPIDLTMPAEVPVVVAGEAGELAPFLKHHGRHLRQGADLGERCLIDGFLHALMARRRHLPGAAA